MLWERANRSQGVATSLTGSQVAIASSERICRTERWLQAVMARCLPLIISYCKMIVVQGLHSMYRSEPRIDHERSSSMTTDRTDQYPCETYSEKKRKEKGPKSTGILKLQSSEKHTSNSASRKSGILSTQKANISNEEKSFPLQQHYGLPSPSPNIVVPSPVYRL